MSYNDAIIIDLLDELDLDIQGFQDARSEPSGLLFSCEGYDQPSTSAAEADVEFQRFEPLDELYMSPRKWVAAGPPLFDDVPIPVEEHQLGRVFQTLTIHVPPRSLSRPPSRCVSPTTPTERAFARLRARGSNLALRALASPEIRHRVLI
ncbi:hypothetical protein K438DRAFT_1967812 [Mycena galopus ATCC 62051]|nr:hypothetical protein K438DRAFT_1967812 [Mycena galopus ATCC 62051]